MDLTDPLDNLGENIEISEPQQNEPQLLETELADKLDEQEQPLVLTKEVKTKPIIKEKPNDQVLSPAVRKIVAENKINLENIKGSGKDGRLLKGDLISLMSKNPSPSERKIKYGQEERIKMTRLRQTIAKRLKQAQENAALLTTFNEVDMTNIIEMRKDNQDDVNAEIEGDEIIYKNYYNISFAVGTDKGLVVPVLKDADVMSFADIEKNIKEISDKAKSGKLTIEDLQGGTFTISNGGVYGSMLSTPILNLPQSGVLGMHNIVERPVVIEGEIMVRPIMYLALSYDHRIIDGKESVSFLKMIKENLEDPRRLFLDI